MTIFSPSQPPFIVDTYAEIDVSWTDGTIVYCRNTNCMYQITSGTPVTIKGNYLYKPYSVTTTSGSVIIYLTDNGLSTGNALFSTIDYVHLDFVNNDPNFGKSYTLTNSNKTLTITAVKQAFTGITLLATNILGSVAISAAANGTALSVLVQGTAA